LVDYFDTVVHVFHHEAREYYKLQKLWSDGKVTKYENL
jgi:ribosome-associated protein